VLHITWQPVAPPPIRNSAGNPVIPDPSGPYGFRFNIYQEATDKLLRIPQTNPQPAATYDTAQRTQSLDLKPYHDIGSTKENRYCIRAMSYVGDGTNGGSRFSEESNGICFGTLVVHVEPQAPPPPPPPTKPDLVVRRVSGPLEVFNGTTTVYEIVLGNDGTPAQGTAQIQINALENFELVQMELIPAGFQCELDEISARGLSCRGSLGGINDPVQTQVAVFRVAVRATNIGPAHVLGSANHDGALDEMEGANNLILYTVTVK
jgi:hypothetical protein